MKKVKKDDGCRSGYKAFWSGGTTSLLLYFSFILFNPKFKAIGLDMHRSDSNGLQKFTCKNDLHAGKRFWLSSHLMLVVNPNPMQMRRMAHVRQVLWRTFSPIGFFALFFDLPLKLKNPIDFQTEGELTFRFRKRICSHLLQFIMASFAFCQPPHDYPRLFQIHHNVFLPSFFFYNKCFSFSTLLIPSYW